MDLELRNKTAIVTGGSRGIGFAIASKLVKEGVSVVIAARNSKELEKAADQLTKETRQVVIPVSVDTTNDESVNDLVKTSVDQLGGIDILVNCAAPVSWKTKNPKIANLTGDLLAEAIDVKVMGYLRCAREVAPFMINCGWGRIINIAGMAARNAHSIIGSIRNVSVAALTKNLANELGCKGINVTCVHPGLTKTELTKELIRIRAATNNTTETLIEEAMESETAIGRMVEATDIASVVCFLASPKSVAIQGDVIPAAGGAGQDIRY